MTLEESSPVLAALAFAAVLRFISYKKGKATEGRLERERQQRELKGPVEHQPRKRL